LVKVPTAHRSYDDPQRRDRADRDAWRPGWRCSDRAVASPGELQATRPLAGGAGLDLVLVLRDDLSLLRIAGGNGATTPLTHMGKEYSP